MGAQPGFFDLQVKGGQIPEDWQKNPAPLAQTDVDARWIVKYSKAKDGANNIDIAIPRYGYKNHTSIDRRYGFIPKSHVTAARCFYLSFAKKSCYSRCPTFNNCNDSISKRCIGLKN